MRSPSQSTFVRDRYLRLIDRLRVGRLAFYIEGRWMFGRRTIGSSHVHPYGLVTNSACRSLSTRRS